MLLIDVISCPGFLATNPSPSFSCASILGPAGGRGQCYFRKYPTSLVFKDSNDLKRIQFPVTNSSPSLSYSFVLDLVGGRGHCYLEYSNGTSRPHEVHTLHSALTLTIHRRFQKSIQNKIVIKFYTRWLEQAATKRC